MGLAGVSPPMTVEDELADRIDAEVRVERAGPGCRRDGTAEFTVTCEEGDLERVHEQLSGMEEALAFGTWR